MATITKKTASVRKTSTKTTNTKKAVAKKVENVENVAEKTVANKKIAKEPKQFKDTDLIPCLCVFPGSVGMTGKRTRNVYQWDEMGTIEYVEFQDLRSEILNRKSPYIYEPLIVVIDEDFLELNPKLQETYEDFYTPEEIMNAINEYDPEDMRNFIVNLPAQLKDNVKSIAATMIQDGDLDSIRKVKIIDEIFGTKLEAIS